MLSWKATPGRDPKAKRKQRKGGRYLPWPLQAATSARPHLCSGTAWRGWKSGAAPGTCVGWQLGEEVRRVLLGETLTLDQVTHGVLGAAVQVVGAADGLGEGKGGSVWLP